MRNVWLVIEHEVRTILGKRSFWITTLFVPVLLLALQTYSVIQESGVQLGSSGMEKEEAKSTTMDIPIIGLVDEAGLIGEELEDSLAKLLSQAGGLSSMETQVDPATAAFPAEMLIPFPNEATARAALEADDIEQYVHIPADYITTGKVTVYDKNFQILRGGDNTSVAFRGSNEWVLDGLINLGLTGDAQLVRALRNPVPAGYAERHVINPPVDTDENDRALAQIVARVLPYMFYFIFLVGSGYLLRSVVAEKENRTVELLLLSLHPRELMMGKILGLSAVTSLQLGVWFGGGMLILDRGAALLNLSAFTFPRGFLVWAILFLGLGFLLFASVMAAAGAMAPNAREGTQVTWLLIIPLLPTLMFGDEPNNPVIQALSFFPFSAPSAMVTRLALGEVPLWQPIVSLVGLALTTYLVVLLAGRFFRAGNLLSHAPFNLRRLATGWRE